MPCFQLIVLVLALYGGLTFASFQSSQQFIQLFKTGEGALLQIIFDGKKQVEQHQAAVKAFLKSGRVNADGFRKSTSPFAHSKLFFSGFIAIRALEEPDSKHEVLTLEVDGRIISGDLNPSGAITFEEISNDEVHKELVQGKLLPEDHVEKYIERMRIAAQNTGKDFNRKMCVPDAIMSGLDELAVKSINKFNQEFVKAEGNVYGIADIVAKTGRADHMFFRYNGLLCVHTSLQLKK